MKIINLISGPRNLSTALMYSFAQRDDCVVFDEPYYGHYLHNGKVKIVHPSEKQIKETMKADEEGVTQNIIESSKTKHVFVKGMAHHYLTKNPKHILEWSNVILIRHPEKLLTSFSKVISQPSIDDIGIKKASEIFTYLTNLGKSPIVIDSDELLKDPKSYLQELCDLLEISFSENMLHWEKGGIKEDGIWAKHWYKNVHNSKGFAIQKTSQEKMPEYLQPVLQKALPYYYILKNSIL